MVGSAMKMKRFFKNRNKKKRLSQDDSFNELKPLEISDADLSTASFETQTISKNTSNKKKQQRQQTKKKKTHKKSFSSDIVKTHDTLNTEQTFLTSGGTSVVLRQECTLGQVILQTGSGRDQTDIRIPGSESSSRTPSSASSQSASHQRWSARRPWSLVETMRGQPLAEFARSHDRISELASDECDDSQYPASNVSPDAICTLPRAMTLDETSITLNRTTGARQNRSRTLTLDFSFFRRFRRNTGSGLSNSKPQHSIPFPAETNTETHGPPHLINVRKKSKKKRQSWQDASNQRFSGCNRSSSGSTTSSSQSEVELPGRTLSSANDSMAFDITQTSIPEEQDISIQPFSSQSSSDQSSYERSRSNCSSTSTATVISVSENTPNRSPYGGVSLKKNDYGGYVTSLGNESVAYETCQLCSKPRRGSIENVRRCFCASAGGELSIVDTDVDVATSSKNAISGTKQSNNRRSDITSSSIASAHSVSAKDLYCADSISTLEASSLFGGSLKCIPRTPPSQLISQTLPRRGGADMVVFRAKARQTKSISASSPQLSSPCRRTLAETEDVPVQGARPRSTTVRFLENSSEIQSRKSIPENTPITTAPKPLVSQLKEESSSTVDSPIKRAIGYPGVVLRRHQNRRLKKSHQMRMGSNEILTGERRAKYAMSLNVEDLPTYEQMQQEELRWRSASLFSRDHHRSEYSATRRWVAADHDRLLTTLAYHRYNSRFTSADDVSAANLMLAGDHSIDDLSNMDDDEFTDLYLASPGSSISKYEMTPNNHSQEPSSKRVKTLRKSVVSFANLISPGKPGRHAKLQRSSSFKESTAPAFKPYRPPGSQSNGGSNGVSGGAGSGHTPGKRSATKCRRNKLWCETFDNAGLDEAEVKRQEAIFELYQGECVMVKDLRMAKQTYRDSMVTLKMLTEEEVNRIFGTLDCLLPLHEDLLSRLEIARAKDGRTEGVGGVFIDWFPTLSPYDEYCANQADAKETLDSVVRREHPVRDFLQRCLESPFSRKLDLWSYLDLPRSRLVKYPLLLKNILKATPAHHDDAALLEKALTVINDIIMRVDDITGERQSRFVQSKLEYIDDKQKCREVDESRSVLCSGQLKGNRGSKFQVFLFDLALVLTRNATRGDKLTYQVYRQPLPLKSLTVDTEEGGKLSGSFRGGILNNDKAKHSFRVRSEELNLTYTLIANDEHDKKQWVNSLLEAISKCRANVEQEGVRLSPITRRTRSEKSTLDKSGEKPLLSVRRSSSVKSEEGTMNSWYNESSTSSSDKDVSTLNNKDKDVVSLKKKSKPSPLSFRRNNKSMTIKTGSTDSLDAKFASNSSESSGGQRARSLSSSPISFLANFPKRNRASSRVSRSESCSTKPPTGRVSQLTHTYNLRCSSPKTLPKSPKRLHPTRSTPNLTAFYQKSQYFDTLDSLEEVKKRLALADTEWTKQTELADQDQNVISSLRSSSINSEVTFKLPNMFDISHLITDSPDNPASSKTSRNFPIAEEECISPLYNAVISASPLHIITSPPPAVSSFHSPAIVLPTIAWEKEAPAAEDAARIPKCDIDESTPICSSSEPVDRLSLVVEDAAMILDTHLESQDDLMSEAQDTVVEEEFTEVALEVLTDIINCVCDSQRAVPYTNDVIMTCQDNFITITAEDGSQWCGNDIEMTV